jgi:hypothetical protein
MYPTQKVEDAQLCVKLYEESYTAGEAALKEQGLQPVKVRPSNISLCLSYILMLSTDIITRISSGEWKTRIPMRQSTRTLCTPFKAVYMVTTSMKRLRVLPNFLGAVPSSKLTSSEFFPFIISVFHISCEDLTPFHDGGVSIISAGSRTLALVKGTNSGIFQRYVQLPH